MFDAVAIARSRDGPDAHARRARRRCRQDPQYDDVVAEVRAFLAERIEAAVAAGIGRDRLCIDPGIGFGKNLQHNLALLRSIGSFRELGVTVLAGASRKRFIGELSGVDDAADRLDGSLAAAVWCAAQGVDVVRVHDVAPTVEALRVGGRDRARAPVTGRDPILLLLHDEGRSGDQWREFVPLLESRFRVIAPDLPPGDESAAIDVVRGALGGRAVRRDRPRDGRVARAGPGRRGRRRRDGPPRRASCSRCRRRDPRRRSTSPCSCSGERTTPWCRCRWPRS